MSEYLKGIRDFLSSFSEPVPEPSLVDDPSGKGSIVVVRQGYEVKRLPGEKKTRRVHVFHELASFADWLNRHAEGDAAEVLVGEEEARAVLGDDPDASVVSCELRFHPTYNAWHGVLGRPLSPKDLFSFVRAVADTFSSETEGGPSAGDVLAGELAKLKAVRTDAIEMNVDPRGFYSVHGATDRVQVDANIPPAFMAYAPIYIGVPDATLEPDDQRMIREKHYLLPILLSMDVGDKGIVFTLTCPSLPRILHEARGDAVSHLRALLDDTFLVGLGDLETEVVAG